jgi:hypothetical protein
MRYDRPFIDRGDTYAPDSIAVRRWCPANMRFNDVVRSPKMALREGEIPLVVCHNSEYAVGFVTELRSSAKELHYEAVLDPELLPEDMLRMMRAGVNPSTSVSVNRLEFAPPSNSSAEARRCKRAILTDISLVWTPAMSDMRVSYIGEVERRRVIGPEEMTMRYTYPPGAVANVLGVAAPGEEGMKS